MPYNALSPQGLIHFNLGLIHKSLTFMDEMNTALKKHKII